MIADYCLPISLALSIASFFPTESMSSSHERNMQLKPTLRPPSAPQEGAPSASPAFHQQPSSLWGGPCGQSGRSAELAPWVLLSGLPAQGGARPPESGLLRAMLMGLRPGSSARYIYQRVGSFKNNTLQQQGTM